MEFLRAACALLRRETATTPRSSEASKHEQEKEEKEKECHDTDDEMPWPDPVLPFELMMAIYEHAATSTERRALRNVCRCLRIAAASPAMPRDGVMMPRDAKTAEEILLRPVPRGWPALRWGRVDVPSAMVARPEVVSLLSRASAGHEDSPLRDFHLRVVSSDRAPQSYARYLDSVCHHALREIRPLWSDRPPDRARMRIAAASVDCRLSVASLDVAAAGYTDRASRVQLEVFQSTPYAELIPPEDGPPLSLRMYLSKSAPGARIGPGPSDWLRRRIAMRNCREFSALAARRQIVALDLDAENSSRLCGVDLHRVCPNLSRLSCSTLMLLMGTQRCARPAFQHLADLRLIFIETEFMMQFELLEDTVESVQTLECVFPHNERAMPKLRRLSVKRKLRASPPSHPSFVLDAFAAIGWFVAMVEAIEGLREASLSMRVAVAGTLSAEERKSALAEMGEVAVACPGAVLSAGGLCATLHLRRTEDGWDALPSRERFPFYLSYRGNERSQLKMGARGD
jgi:hypothetical protein